MRKFFSGWKRKGGVIVLLLACVLVAGWLRSRTTGDIVLVYSGTNKATAIASIDCSLMFIERLDAQMTSFFKVSLSEPLQKISDMVANQDFQRRWVWQFYGLGEVTDSVRGTTFRIIPYWSIVLPLTALSASLPLSKPGTRKPSPAKEVRPG